MVTEYDAKIFEILRGEFRQGFPVDLVLTKRRLVALKTETS
jgi:hypothetical protein